MDPVTLISNLLLGGGAAYLLGRAGRVWYRERANDALGAADPAAAALVLTSASPAESCYLGCLLAGAAGDALGRMTESLPRWLTRARYGTVREYRRGVLRPVRGLGHYTDDTQMTLCVARSIDDGGRFQPELLRRELIAWLDYRIGAGRASVASASRLARGVPWEQAGDRGSAGNGSAIRVAPIGLAYHRDHEALLAAAAASSVGTHAAPLAVDAARVAALGVALALDADPATFSGEAFLARLAEVPRELLWRKRLAFAASLLRKSAESGLGRIGTGGFVLDSVAAALYLFARLGPDLEKAVVLAANAGGDTDSVASLAGNLCGALAGHHAIPAPWLAGLQHRDYIALQAHRLYIISGQ